MSMTPKPEANRELIYSLIEIVIKNKLNSNADRRGGFLAVWNGKYLICQSFGEIPDEKVARYCTNATEKVTRLLSNRDTRSMTTRDEEKEIWGGGIRYEGMIVAFSGFDEDVDEAISLICTIYACMEIASVAESPDFINIFKRTAAREVERSYADNTKIIPLLEAHFQAV